MVEGIAAITLILPAFMIMVAVVIEINSVLLLKATLDDAARSAARGCALAYHWPPVGVSQVPTGTLYSPDAQGDTVAPATTSGTTPTTSPTVLGTSGAAATSSLQPTTANDAWARIRVANMITNNTQFSATYTPASVNNTAQPQYQTGHVTVTVSSKVANFPNPDPLQLKNLIPNYVITSTSTYSL